MEEKLAETLEVKAQLEAKSEADQAKILHLESKLVQLSLSESTSSTSKVGDRKRVEELRKYKEALKTERHALEHILNHGAKPDPLTCHLCKPGSKFLPIIASEDHEKRLVEIDVLFEAIDEAIDMKNAIIVGHQHPKVEVFFLSITFNFLYCAETSLFFDLFKLQDEVADGRSKVSKKVAEIQVFFCCQSVKCSLF